MVQQSSSPSNSDPDILSSHHDSLSPSLHDTVKIKQIIHQFFLKSVLVILSLRTASPSHRSTLALSYNNSPKSATRNNRWFNIVLPQNDALSKFTQSWRNQNSFPSPLHLDIYLETHNFPAHQSLLLLNPPDSPVVIAPGKSPILLERWTIQLDSSSTTSLDPSSLYKHLVLYIRSLYSLLPLLPAFHLYRQSTLPSSAPGVRLPFLRYRINAPSSLLTSQTSLPNSPKFSSLPLYPGETQVTAKFALPDVSSPLGILRILTVYRQNCAFQLRDTESLISSQILNLSTSTLTPSPANLSLPTRFECSRRTLFTHPPSPKSPGSRISHVSSPSSLSRLASKFSPAFHDTKLTPSPLNSNTEFSKHPSPESTTSSQPINTCHLPSPSSLQSPHPMSQLTYEEQIRQFISTLEQNRTLASLSYPISPALPSSPHPPDKKSPTPPHPPRSTKRLDLSHFSRLHAEHSSLIESMNATLCQPPPPFTPTSPSKSFFPT